MNLTFLNRLLVYAGLLLWVISLPSGLLHSVLGKAKYALDGLMILHLMVSSVHLIRIRHYKDLLFDSWPLLLSLLLFLPAFWRSGNYFTNMDSGTGRNVFLIGFKWYFLWFDALIIGYLMSFEGVLPGKTGLLTALLFCLMAADALVGIKEIRSGTYFLDTSSEEETAFGVQAARTTVVESYVRVKGLQRDVFFFSNLMGLGVVCCIIMIFLKKNPFMKGLFFLLLPLFGYPLYASGGRSAFIGISFALSISLFLLIAPHFTKRFSGLFFLGAFAACWGIIYIGIGPLTESVSNLFFRHSYIGDPTSAYDRDYYWSMFFDKMKEVPLIFLVGGPVAALFDSHAWALLAFADNQLIWQLYHNGIWGILLFVYYYYRKLCLVRRIGAFEPFIIFSVLLCFVLGESVARDNFFMPGYIPLMIMCGYLAGVSGSVSTGDEDFPNPDNISSSSNRTADSV